MAEESTVVTEQQTSETPAQEAEVQVQTDAEVQTDTPAQVEEPKADPIEMPNPEVLTYDDVKYFSQLDKDTASNKDIMDSVKDYKTVSDLVKAHAELSGKMKNALIIPGKDSPTEEVKDFFFKLGVPEKPEDYKLQNGDFAEEEIAPLREQFRRDVLYRNGITNIQGTKIWNACLAMLMTERKMNIQAFERAKASFNDRHSDLLKEQFPVESDRKAAMNEDLDMCSEFFTETGLGKTFKDLGLVYNPDVMHRIAQYHKSNRAKGIIGTTNTSKDEGGLFPQSKAFNDAFGK